jgi:hypothetical protein
VKEACNDTGAHTEQISQRGSSEMARHVGS